jgi:hypothetical protein
MNKYINQLLEDILIATANVAMPYAEKEWDIEDWLSEEEEDKTAPVRNLQEWTGISKEMLPPQEMLNDEQIEKVLSALNKMLNAYNCNFVLPIAVPPRIQYAAIRDNYDQEVKVKTWHMGFFELCKRDTEHYKCALGSYCQCAFFSDFFSGFSDEEFSPEEERARNLEIELIHIKRKYGDEWMKYYPYHLDADYDDDYGNPYSYGWDDEENDF